MGNQLIIVTFPLQTTSTLSRRIFSSFATSTRCRTTPPALLMARSRSSSAYMRSRARSTRCELVFAFNASASSPGYVLAS